MYDKESPHLPEGLCYSRAPAQSGCRRLECPRDAWSTWSVDLSQVCNNRHGWPVPVPPVSGALPLLVRPGRADSESRSTNDGQVSGGLAGVSAAAHDARVHKGERACRSMYINPGE